MDRGFRIGAGFVLAVVFIFATILLAASPMVKALGMAVSDLAAGYPITFN